MHKKLLCVLVASALLVVGCANNQSPQEQSGMVIGGLVGGLLGSHVGAGEGRTTAVLLGTLVGTAIGGSVGRSMNDSDRLKTAKTLETVRTGVPSAWVNPDTGHHYTVIPTRTIDAPSGPCREYTVDAVIGGRKDKVFGTACRQPDGSWQSRP